MTAEREAMTLEMEWPFILTSVNGKEYVPRQHAEKRIRELQAHLSRPAEPVSAVSVWNPDEMTTLPATLTTTHPPEPARDAKCKWSQDVDGNWETDCDNLHILIDGTPYDNEMGFCCYCGHAIDQVLYHDAAMAQESGDAKEGE